jgi:hypothetical protein
MGILRSEKNAPTVVRGETVVRYTCAQCIGRGVMTESEIKVHNNIMPTHIGDVRSLVDKLPDTVIQNPDEPSGISKFGSGIVTVARGANKLQKALFDEPPPKKKTKKKR